MKTMGNSIIPLLLIITSMKKLVIGAITAAALALPVITLAATGQLATYQYVSTSGQLETETAGSAEQALLQPTDIAPHSGVILVTGSPVSDPTTGPVANSVTGTYTDTLTGIGTQARTILLTLMPDGTASMTSFYANGSATMFENGTWTGSGSDQVMVTLTTSDGSQLPTPDILDFTQSGSNLQATSYNSAIYGSQGMTFVPE